MSTPFRIAVAGALIAAFSAMGSAQQPQAVRVVGTITAIDGPTLTVKTRQGDVKVNVTSDVAVFGVERRTPQRRSSH